jgi:hypothetical protein
MKTNEVIDLLTRGAGAAPRGVVQRRFVPAVLVAFAISAALAWWSFGFVPSTVHAQPAWWLKLGYAVALSGAACWWAALAGRPGARTRAPAMVLAAVVVGMSALAVFQMMQGGQDSRWASWLGSSWKVCPRNVFMLSLPALVLALWALRGLAPTRLGHAGFAAGAWAGGVGAVAYSMACSETSVPFVATWYTLGIAASALLGAWLGPRVLRW